jgi:PAS domain S-box-containing protein
MRDAKQGKNNIPVTVEQSFSELEQLYRTAPVGLCFIDPDFRFLRVNEYLAAIHGHPVEAHLGKTVREILPVLADDIEQILNKVLDMGEELLDVDFAGKLLTDPTADAHWRASYHPVRDDEGRILGISIVVKDITDLRLKERALDERAQFERIISELSTMLISLPAEEIDRKIEDGLGLIGRFMDVDRCFIARFSEDKKEFHMTHMWFAENVSADEHIFTMRLCEDAPWLTGHMLRDEAVIFKSMDEMPASVVHERAYCESVDLQSTAIVSLIVEDDVIGMFGFDMIGRQRQWPEDVLQRLRLAGGMFTSVLTRQRDQAQLDVLNRFEQQITNISSRFVNIPGKRVDSGIEDALGAIGECMDTDLGTLLLFDPERQLYHVTHEWQVTQASTGPAFKGVYVDEGFPWLARALGKREPLFIHSLDQWPEEASIERAACEQVGIKSVLWVPFEVGDQVLGYIALNTLRQECTWPDNYIHRLRLLGEIFGNALLRKQSEEKLTAAFKRIAELKDRLESENQYLRDVVKTRYGHEEIIGEGKAIRHMLVQAEQVAATDSTVLLVGETGTGKELLAREVNCGALPATLIEAELFGREKGAYTGALSRQIGRFELADQSTLFLDEIGELAPELQVRLLRVLEDGTFERLGSTRTIKVDVRVIAATNRDLAAEVRSGQFRKDLFYRLNVFPVNIPPLRERREDIPLLVWAFVREFSKKMGKGIERIPVEAMEKLQRYAWPGNVRELRNVVERALILAHDQTLHIDLSTGATVQESQEQSLQAVERAHIEHVLAQTNWRIAGKSGAAEILGIKPTTLRSRMERLGVPTRNSRGH